MKRAPQRVWRRFALVVSAAMIVSAFEGMPAAAAPPPPAVKAAADMPATPSPKTERQRPAVPQVGDFSREPSATGLVPSLPGDVIRRAGFDPTGKRVIGRTEKTTTYADGVGNSTLLVHGVPVNFKDRAGIWRQIDSRLRVDEDGNVANGAGPVSVKLGRQTGKGRLITLSGEGWSLGADVAGLAENRPAALDGPTARYREVLPGVDLEETVGQDYLKETFVLSKPTPAPLPSVIRSPLALNGLTPSTAPDGTIQFTDAEGIVVLRAPVGVATDSSEDLDEHGATPHAPVVPRLVKYGNGWAIELELPTRWLNDPARVYPVYVDPTFTFSAGRQTGGYDVSVGSGCGHCWYDGQPNEPAGNYGQVEGAAYVNRVGKVNFDGRQPAACCLWEFWSYLYFDVDQMLDHSVSSAYLKGWVWDGGSFNIWPVGAPWTPGSFGWANRIGHACSSCSVTVAPANDSNFTANITGIAQNWANRTYGSFGLSLDNAGAADYVKVGAFEQVWQGKDPYLEITFSNQEAPWPSQSQLSPAHETVTTNPTPLLSVPAMTDAEGDQVSYWFRLGSDSEAESGQMLNSGWITPAIGVAPTFQVPEGTLQDGVTYYWKVFTWDGYAQPPHPNGTPVMSSWPPASLKLDLRLGDGGPSPMDGAGSVGVNMATGNVTATFASPSFDVLGGDVGVSYTYNSKQPQGGLVGEYYKDCNGDTAWPTQPAAERVDPAVNFVWSGSPVPGLVGSENYCVRWTGLFSVPSSNGWCFDASHDDGLRVWVNGILVIDRWDDGSTVPGQYGMDCLPVFSDASVPITIEYYNHFGPGRVGLYLVSPTYSGYVPASWLSTTPKTMPPGWSLSIASDELSYARARIGSDTVTLESGDGASFEYRRTATGSWTPPPGEDSVLGTGTEGGATVYIVQGTDGLMYTFNDKGVLIRAESSEDDLNRAAPQFEFATDSGRVSAVKDPVNPTRKMQLKYANPGSGASNCPTSPSGFDPSPPGGFLCAVDYWDNTQTRLHYLNGQLARIVDPGGVTTNFVYDGNGRLAKIRDALGNDSVLPPVNRPDDDTTWTGITYTADGRAWTVTEPAGTAGALRAQRTYRYLSATETQLDIAGISPAVGFSRRVRFDGAARMTSDTDGAGVETVYSYDSAERVITTIGTNNDAAKSLKATVVYDEAGRPIRTYGPARPSCFTDQTPNNTCTVPMAQTSYDEGIQGLAAAYWANATMANSTARHSTGIGGPSGAVDVNWGGGAPTDLPADNWSMRLTGEVLFPSTGTVTFKLTTVDTTDKARLWVDDKLVVDAWAGGTTWNSTGTVAGTANSRKRIRLDYADVTGNASIQLRWTPTGQAEAVVPGVNLAPRYGLPTTVIDADGRKVTNEFADMAAGIGPEYGLITASSAWVDATTQLRTTTAYESPSASTYMRRLSKTLPKGASTTTTFAYYAPEQTAPSNDCGGVAALGMLKSETGPLPATGSRIVREYVYDSLNRAVGSRIVGDQYWSCRTYDARGRVLSDRDAKGVTTFYDYSTPGTVFTSFNDSAGQSRWTLAESNLVGQQTSYTDEHGTTTRVVYDRAGRATASYRKFAGAAETQLMAWAYDNPGRLALLSDYSASQSSPRTVTFGYDTSGRLTTTARPNGVTTAAVFDTASGRVESLSNKLGATDLSPWSYVYTTGGRIATETTTGRVRAFTYDGAGRLTQTLEGATTRRYAYDSNSNRCANAASCSSPTYTYDSADRLTASPFGSNYTYDSHGNLTTATPNTTFGPGSLSDSWGYDAASSVDAHSIPLTVNANGALSANLDTTPTPTYQSDTATGALAPSASVSVPVAVRLATYVKANLSWTAGTGGQAPLILRLKNANGAVVRSVTGSSGSLDLGRFTTHVTAMWSLEIVNTSSTINVPSYSMPWSITTATSPAVSGSLAPGATDTVSRATEGQGVMAVEVDYDQGVKNVSSMPAGTVGMGGTSESPFSVTGSGTVTGSVDWGSAPTYTNGSQNGSLASNGTWSGSVPARGVSFLKADLTWTAAPAGMATVTLRFKDASGAPVKTLSGASGTLGIGYLTGESAATYTIEVVNNSADRTVPSFTVQWSSTTASATALNGGLAAGEISAAIPLTAAGQGRLSTDFTYTHGTRPESSAPTGSVTAGSTSDHAVNVTGTGAMSASLDWPDLPVYTAWNASPNLPSGSPAWTTPVVAQGPSHVYGSAAWQQGTHNVSSPQSGANIPLSTVERTLNVTAQGTISATIDWNSVTHSLTTSETVSALAPWTRAITVSANGNIAGSISWANGTIPTLLELSLLDSSGNVVATSNTPPGADDATLPATAVTASLSNKKTYTLRVTATGPQVNFSLSSSYPVTANVDLELWNPAGTTKLASATGTTTKPETVSYAMPAGAPTGAYKLKVVSKDFAASWSGTSTAPVADFASVTMRLRNTANNTVVKTATSASGSIELSYLTSSDASLALEVLNNSNDLKPESLAVVWSNTTVSSTALPGSVPAGTTSSTDTPAAGPGWIRAPMTWAKSSHQVAQTRSDTVTANATDTELVNVTGQGTVSASVNWTTPAASLNQTNQSVNATTPWNRTITVSGDGVIKARINWTNGTIPSLLELELLDSNDTVVARSNTPIGASEASIPDYAVTASLSNKETYTLRVRDTGPAMTFSMTGSHPATADVDLELWNPAGTTKLAQATSTTSKPEALSYVMPAGASTGDYQLRVTSRSHTSTYTADLSVPTLDWASLTARLKDPAGTVVKTMTSASGSLELGYLAPSGGTYRLELQNNSSDILAASVAGQASAPATRTPNVDIDLYDPNGFLVASSHSTSARPETLSYPVPASGPFGNYVYRVSSANWASSYTLSETHHTSGYATVRARLRNAANGVLVAETTSSNGSLSFDYLASGAGNYNLFLSNLSTDFAVPSYSGVATGVAQRTANVDLELWGPAGTKVAQANGSTKPETLTYAVASGATGTYTFKVVSRDYDASWTLNESHPISEHATAVGRLKNQSGTVVASATSSNGKVAFDYLAPAAGTYTFELQNTSPDLSVPSYGGSASRVIERYGTFNLELKDGTGAVVAIGTSARPSDLSASVTPGNYTLSVTPVTGAGNATLTGSYPRSAKETITYDGRDHATSIDDGIQTVTETLAPSGRVLRRRVVENATGSLLEDTILGYEDGSDAPAYSRPFGSQTVTTYVRGPGGLLLTDVAGAASWAVVNMHGHLVGTLDSAGAFTPTPPTDEFGVGDSPASRLGWLGGKQRFTANSQLGLMRMGVRLYDPALGRFLGVDPVEGGSCNDYDYVCGDPVNLQDTGGTLFMFVAAAVVGVAIVGTYIVTTASKGKGKGKGKGKNQQDVKEDGLWKDKGMSRCPTKAECKTAIKLLKSPLAKANKRNLKLTEATKGVIRELVRLGTISLKHVPYMRSRFPVGLWGELTLNDIKAICKDAYPRDF